MEKTTINISSKTKAFLEKRKLVKRESYNEVIKRLIKQRNEVRK